MKNFIYCTLAQKRERWENALRVLRGLTRHQRREHFNMAWYAVATDCGTVACAAGHCGLDWWFRRHGFSIDRDSIPDSGYVYPRTLSGGSIAIACVNFFGIEGTTNIFFNNSRRPVGKVIREIRAHIKTL